jgi:hypothetical protein
VQRVVEFGRKLGRIEEGERISAWASLRRDFRREEEDGIGADMWAHAVSEMREGEVY